MFILITLIMFCTLLFASISFFVERTDFSFYHDAMQNAYIFGAGDLKIPENTFDTVILFFNQPVFYLACGILAIIIFVTMYIYFKRINNPPINLEKHKIHEKDISEKSARVSSVDSAELICDFIDCGDLGNGDCAELKCDFIDCCTEDTNNNNILDIFEFVDCGDLDCGDCADVADCASGIDCSF